MLKAVPHERGLNSSHIGLCRIHSKRLTCGCKGHSPRSYDKKMKLLHLNIERNGEHGWREGNAAAEETLWYPPLELLVPQAIAVAKVKIGSHMNQLFEMRNAVKSINLRGNRVKVCCWGRIKRTSFYSLLDFLSLNFLFYEIKGLEIEFTNTTLTPEKSINGLGNIRSQFLANLNVNITPTRHASYSYHCMT